MDGESTAKDRPKGELHPREMRPVPIWIARQSRRHHEETDRVDYKQPEDCRAAEPAMSRRTSTHPGPRFVHGKQQSDTSSRIPTSLDQGDTTRLLPRNQRTPQDQVRRDGMAGP